MKKMLFPDTHKILNYWAKKKLNYHGLQSSKAPLRGSHCVYSPQAPNNIALLPIAATALQTHSSPFGDKFKTDKGKALLIHDMKEYVEMEIIRLHSLSTLVLETAIGPPPPNKKPTVPTE
jgi:hypothetical protein